MAFIQCHFWSDALQMQSEMWVLLPQGACLNGKRRRPIPTLYLLHGLSDDHTVWLRRTSIERYADAAGLAVVMPTTHRGFYTDMAHGPRYWTFVSEEVPKVARAFFPLSGKRAANFVAGLSMGGYGAFKLGLRCPEKFAAAASLSGALDATRRGTGKDPQWVTEMHRIFGDPAKVAGGDNDLFHHARVLVRGARKRKPRPRLYQICGDKDFLLEENHAFRDHAIKIGLEVKYEEDPGYAHTWDYWDLTIQRVIQWLPLKRSG